MSRKIGLNLDEDSLKVIDPNQTQIDDPNTNNEILELNEEIQNINYELNNIINNEQEWVDANQISIDQNEEFHTNELRTNQPKSILFQTREKVKKDPTRSLIVSSLITNLFFGIWLFILCMLPPITSESGNIATLFYKSSSATSIFGFNTLGYVNLVFTILVFILNIVTISFRIKTKNKDFYFNNLKKNANITFYVFLSIYLLIILLMTFNLLIPPLGINNNSSYWSFMYILEGTNNVVKSAGWYIIIVLFSLSVSLYFVTLIVLGMLQSNVLNIAKMKEKHQALKAFFEDLKKLQKEKKANKQKKKQILAEEEQLLNNLQEVTEEQKQLISEEEFQERMKFNNEIKNKIRELQKQQEEIKRQQSIFLKNRKEDTINRRPLKPKKQEITIPDKELEEIFKNIELD